MDPAIIILSNGVDNTLRNLDLKPFTFTTISANDPKPMGKRKVSYQYKSGCDPDGSNPKTYTHDMYVCTYYDLIQHLFAPHCSTKAEYLIPEQVGNFDHYDYNGIERFPCFTLNDSNNWDMEMICLLDAIRLFKVNRAGFGLAIDLVQGIGLNDRYKFDTNISLWRHLPIFTLNEKERLEFQTFYSSYRCWFFKTDCGSKDQLARQLLNLYRLSFHVSDPQTSFIILSEIWELFSQYSPKKKKSKSKKFSHNNNDTVDYYNDSYIIRDCVSRMIRNTGVVAERSQDNIYQMVRYLYSQRSYIVHKDLDNDFDDTCIHLAFDITRCLLLKIINAKDRDIEVIQRNLENCDKEDAAYRMDSVKIDPVDESLMDRIFKPI